MDILLALIAAVAFLIAIATVSGIPGPTLLEVWSKLEQMRSRKTKTKRTR